MRAVLINDLNISDDAQIINVDGDNAHHLIKVVRIKNGEEVLLLNGNGLRAKSTVLSVEKKSLTLKIKSFETLKPNLLIDLAIGLPKKDAFEDILKSAVELGIQNIFPLKTKFSQIKELNLDRAQKIFENAMIQSNNPFTCKLQPIQTLSDLPTHYDETIYFSNREDNFKKVGPVGPIKFLFFIGPEGGFSQEEEDLIKHRFKNLKIITLPTYILRSPTAVSVGVGNIIGKFGL